MVKISFQAADHGMNFQTLSKNSAWFLHVSADMLAFLWIVISHSFIALTSRKIYPFVEAKCTLQEVVNRTIRFSGVLLIVAFKRRFRGGF